MTVAARDKTLAEREITITRVFDVPRATVFRAWTDANQLAVGTKKRLHQSGLRNRGARGRGNPYPHAQSRRLRQPLGIRGSRRNWVTETP